MPSQTLTCKDCSQSFDFSEREQTFFAEKGFSAPTRCSNCRAARKGGGSQQTRPQREMYTAHCKNGGHTVEIPFEPDSSRPFNCRDHKSAPRVMFDAFCVGGGHDTKVPFQPDTRRDFFCRDHPQPKFSGYCVGGSHTVQGLNREPDPKRDFYCRDHPKPMFDAFCTGGSHTLKVPFEPKADRLFYCKVHPQPKYSAFCVGGGHTVPNLPFEPDINRDFFCRDHPRPKAPRGGGYRGSGQQGPRNDGLGLTFRSDNFGKLTGSSTRSGLPNLSFNQDRRGNTRGSSERIPGLGLTFHKDNRGNLTGTSQYVPGIGTFTTGRNGKMKSFTDNQGFRSGPGGKSKGSSRRI